MRLPRLAPSIVLALVAGSGLPAQQTGTQSDEQPPRDIGLTERTERRLAQVDFTVVGPPEIAAHLEASDLKVKVHLRRLREFQLDRICNLPGATPEVEDQDEIAAEPPPVPAGLGPASYLFYVDQNQLTLAGRQRALELLRRMTPELITGGNRAMLVSNSRELHVVEPLTDDVERLLEAIDRVEQDRDQWNFFAQEEDAKVADVVRTLNREENVFSAISRARMYHREEVWRTERDIRRLSMTLSRLDAEAAPKAVFYFADTMRSNPGQHYLQFFGLRMQGENAVLSMMSTESFMATQPFDRLVNRASAQGVRFYTVLARGMTAEFDENLPSAAAYNTTLANPSTSRQRFYSVRDSLANLATETGGHAFVNGQSAARILRRVRDDFSCVYLLSFDPTGLPQDSPLRIVISAPGKDVELRTRGRVVLQSPSARVTARLVSAFASPETGVEEFRVKTGLVPIDYGEQGYSALLQISVPGMLIPSANWDLGASVVRQEKVWRETSGHLGINRPGVPVVFESEIEFKPGEYEIVSVAHELSTGLVASDQLRVDWPDPGKSSATAGPIAVVQPETAAFLRDEQSRQSGSLARTRNEPVQHDRPTAFVALVCRGPRQSGQLTIERELIGERAHEFPPLELDLTDRRCAQVRDLVPADSLGSGYYLYEMRVLSAGRELHRADRDFIVLRDEDGASRDDLNPS